MADKTVTITVNSVGDFTYSWALLGVKGGDNITWNAGPSTLGFTITFRPDTPMTVGPATLESGDPNNTILRTVKNGLAVGTVYYYSVTATYSDGTKFTDPFCPELIIR